MSRNCQVGKNLSLDCLFTADETQRVSRKLECQKLRTEFIKDFGSAHCLRHYPPSDESFNPRASVALIITFLHNLAPSEALFRARMYSLMYRVRRIGRWMRIILKARDDQKEKILRHWMENDSEKKKTAYTKLCRECRILPPGQCKPSIETYNKYQITEQDRKQAVAWVYELKRKSFRMQFHAWYVSMKASEVEHKEKLQKLCQRNLFSWNSGNRNITNALSSDFSGELDKLGRSRPVFDFSVDSVSFGELHAAWSKIRSPVIEESSSTSDADDTHLNEAPTEIPSLPPLYRPSPSLVSSEGLQRVASDESDSVSVTSPHRSSCRPFTKPSRMKGSMSSEGTSVSSRSNDLSTTPKSSKSGRSSLAATGSLLTPLHMAGPLPFVRTTSELVSDDDEAYDSVMPLHDLSMLSLQCDSQPSERQRSSDSTILYQLGNTADGNQTVSFGCVSLASPHDDSRERLLRQKSSSPKFGPQNASQSEKISTWPETPKISQANANSSHSCGERSVKRSTLWETPSVDSIPLGKFSSPPRRRNVGAALSPLPSATKQETRLSGGGKADTGPRAPAFAWSSPKRRTDGLDFSEVTSPKVESSHKTRR